MKCSTVVNTRGTRRHPCRHKALLPLYVVLFLLPAWSFAQTVNVKGRVTDDKGSPLPSASVVDKNSAAAAVSDTNGYYSNDGWYWPISPFL